MSSAECTPDKNDEEGGETGTGEEKSEEKSDESENANVAAPAVAPGASSAILANSAHDGNSEKTVRFANVAYMEEADEGGNVMDDAEKTEARLHPKKSEPGISGVDPQRSASPSYSEGSESQAGVGLADIDPSDSASPSVSPYEPQDNDNDSKAESPSLPPVHVSFAHARPYSYTSLETLFPGRRVDAGNGRVRILRPWDLTIGGTGSSHTSAYPFQAPGSSYYAPSVANAFQDPGSSYYGSSYYAPSAANTVHLWDASAYYAPSIMNTMQPSYAPPSAPSVTNTYQSTNRTLSTSDGQPHFIPPQSTSYSSNPTYQNVGFMPPELAWDRREQEGLTLENPYELGDPLSYQVPSTARQSTPYGYTSDQAPAIISTANQSAVPGTTRDTKAPPVVSFPLARAGVGGLRQPSLTSPWAKAWDDSKSHVGDAGESEFLVVTTVEHYTDESEESAITLVKRTPGKQQMKLDKLTSIRWLHLKRKSLNLKDLEDLVFNCPHLSDHIKSVALALLDTVRNKMVTTSANGTFFKPGSAIRYDGKHTHDPLKVDESVIFFSAPYLLCKSASKRSRLDETEHSARTLLQFLHNCDPGDKREINQVISKVWKSTDDVLHVSQLWCMLLGNDVILTAAELPLSDILGPSIAVVEKDSLCTIMLESWNYAHRHFVKVEPPITYIEFLRIVSEKTPVPQTAKILDSDRNPLNAEKWLELMEIDGLQELNFYYDDRQPIIDNMDRHSIEEEVPDLPGRFSSATDDVAHIPASSIPRPLSTSRIGPASQRRGSYMLPVMTPATFGTTKPTGRSIRSDTDIYTRTDQMQNVKDGTQSSNITTSPLSLSIGSFSSSERSSLDEEARTDEHHRGTSITMSPDRSNSSISQSLKSESSDEETGSPNPPATSAHDSPVTAPATEAELSGASMSGKEPEVKVRFAMPDMSDPSLKVADGDADSLTANDKESERIPARDGRKPDLATRIRLHPKRPAPGYEEGEAADLTDSDSTVHPTKSTATVPKSRSIEEPPGPAQPLTAENLRRAQPPRLQKLYSSGNVVNDWTAIRAYAETYYVDSSSTEDEDDNPDPPAAYGHRPRSSSSGLSALGSIRSYALPRPIMRPSIQRSGPSASSQTSQPAQLHQSHQARGVRFQAGVDTYSEVGTSRSPSPAFRSTVASARENYTSPFSPNVKRRYSRITDTDPSTQRAVAAAFFTWNVSHSSAATKDSVQKVFRLLSRIGSTLCEDEASMKVYEGGFECTFQDLKERLRVLLEVASEARDIRRMSSDQKPSSQPEKDHADGTDAAGAPGAKAFTAQPRSDETKSTSALPHHDHGTIDNDKATVLGGSGATAPNGQPNQEEGTPTSIDVEANTDFVDEVRTLLQDLFHMSRSVMGLFVPEAMALPHTHDAVMKKYWGSLERIFRLVRVLLMMTAQSREATLSSAETTGTPINSFTIRSPTPHLTDSFHSSCDACIRGVEYKSIHEALDHMHTTHGNENHTPKYKPADDPCTAWIRMQGRIDSDMAAIDENVRLALAIVRDFIEQLGALRRAAEELHMSIVLQPPPSISKSKGPVAASVATDKVLPSLPSSVVRAFEEIVMLHLQTAHRLSLVSRRRGYTYKAALLDAGSRCRQCFEDATKLFESAKRVLIIPGVATSATRGINLEPVGPQYLMLVILAHLQNRAVTPTSASASVKHPSKPRDGGLRDQPAIDLYADYADMLQYQVNRRPQRRLFLDIRGLEEELEAAAKLSRAQQALLERLAQALDPTTYRITTAARRAMFPLEAQFVDRQRARLWEAELGYHALQEKARDLTEQVRQSIEILEEGHGKAIRVFTIVTLFFLPLTFISGFMGMNTADIRNTNRNQTFFWIVALPVTAGVLAIAFVYGYRGDAISEFVSEVLESRRAIANKLHRPVTGIAGTGLMTSGREYAKNIATSTGEVKGGAVSAQAGKSWAGLSAASRRWLTEAVQHPRLRRKGYKTTKSLPRRATEDSMA